MHYGQRRGAVTVLTLARFYWGDWYDRIIGPEAAQTISPMRTAIDLGMQPSSHSDAPVALPNLMQVMETIKEGTSVYKR